MATLALPCAWHHHLAETSSRVSNYRLRTAIDWTSTEEYANAAPETSMGSTILVQTCDVHFLRFSSDEHAFLLQKALRRPSYILQYLAGYGNDRSVQSSTKGRREHGDRFCRT